MTRNSTFFIQNHDKKVCFRAYLAFLISVIATSASVFVIPAPSAHYEHEKKPQKNKIRQKCPIPGES